MSLAVGVMGAGAWGTALALVAARAGHEVRLWVREAEVAEGIAANRVNERFLPGIVLDRTIIPVLDQAGLASCAVLMLAVPAQHVRRAAQGLAGVLAPGTPVALCAKGIETESLELLSEVLAEALPQGVPAVLSGPSFAADVARGLPTAVTLAVAGDEAARLLTRAVGSPSFRPYRSKDLVGAQIGGAVKNVLAIACGIVEGRGLGESARAALITRGFAEMARLGLALGAEPRTLAGLSGLGDLILTASSPKSRNYSLGIELGRGVPLAEVLAGRTGVTEGVHTARAAAELARRHGVEMPITAAVAGIIAGSLAIDQAIAELLNRPFREEGD